MYRRKAIESEARAPAPERYHERVSLKRILVVVLVLVVGFLGVRSAIRALASDETKITWLIEDMAEGFNDGRAGTAVGGLAAEWRHEGSRVDRDLLREVLAREVLSARTSRSGELPHRVAIPEELLLITVEEDFARVECEAIFDERNEEEWKTVWCVRIWAELERGEDGWRIVRSRHEDLVGRGWH